MILKKTSPPFEITHNFLHSLIANTNESKLQASKYLDKQEMIDRIATTMAHEIRNPLTTVRGYLQVIQDRVDDESSKIISTLLIPEIDAINNVLTSFLQSTVAKPPYTDIICIDSLIRDNLQQTLLHQIDDDEIKLSIDIPIQAQNISILGNTTELTQVVLHLFQNSLQARTDQSLQIHIKAEKVTNFIKFTFTDNGEGIRKEHFSKIFDPFFSTKDESMGLGLSTVKNIITNHGGCISFDSNPQFTSFYICLPIHEERLPD